MIAARDRARRVNAALGERTATLMGCRLAVLIAASELAVPADPAPAANSPLDGTTAGCAAPQPVAESRDR